MAFSTVGWCTSEAMETLGEQFGLPAANREKNKLIREAGLASIETARHAGVRLDYGTDLLGEAQPMQLRELVIRREVEPAADILRSMWEVSAELCGLAGFVGVLTPGAYGDVVVSTVDPLEDLAGFADHRGGVHPRRAGRPGDRRAVTALGFIPIDAAGFGWAGASDWPCRSTGRRPS